MAEGVGTLSQGLEAYPKAPLTLAIFVHYVGRMAWTMGLSNMCLKSLLNRKNWKAIELGASIVVSDWCVCHVVVTLQVFKLVEDPDKMAKCLVNLSNIYELQVGRERRGTMREIHGSCCTYVYVSVRNNGRGRGPDDYCGKHSANKAYGAQGMVAWFRGDGRCLPYALACLWWLLCWSEKGVLTIDIANS